MEIQKFEAYKYKGPTLKTVNRKQFIEQITDIFTDIKICDYDVCIMSYSLVDETMFLSADKKNGDKYVDNFIIKLDLSDMGIEFGSMKWNDDEEDFEDFIPEVNLDTDTTKQMKSYRQTLGKYNV
jgi:hypothetical protein